MNHLFKQLLVSVGVFTLTVACNSSDFAGSDASGGTKNNVKSPGSNGEEGNPKDPNGSGGTPGGSGGTPGGSGEPTNEPLPSDPFTIDSGDGGANLNVPLGKVEITMVVDHVTDFVISNSELYAVHHELAVPKFGSLKLYDTAGKLISTENWLPNWEKCPQYSEYDANCSSSKLKLKAGSKLKGQFTKVAGRGGMWKFADNPFTVRVTDCGSGAHCTKYGGGVGGKQGGESTYIWIME